LERFQRRSRSLISGSCCSAAFSSPPETLRNADSAHSMLCVASVLLVCC
jgi:hypothetical protein